MATGQVQYRAWLEAGEVKQAEDKNSNTEAAFDVEDVGNTYGCMFKMMALEDITRVVICDYVPSL